MDLLATAALVALLFVKEAGVPVPVPGDLIVIGAGVAVAGDAVAGAASLAAILVAGYAGGSLQFVLTRGVLRPAMIGLLVRVGVGRDRLDAMAEHLRRHGARGVAVARTTPGVRVPAIAASGLAALPFAAFLVGLIVGNTVFVGGHFLLGFVVGPTAVDLVASSAGIAAGVVALVVLAAIGAVGWSMLRRRRQARRRLEQPDADDVDTAGTTAYGAWADAACPACLAIAIIRTTR
jgi:membrane-associated protein